jgi:hypothetical protein
MSRVNRIAAIVAFADRNTVDRLDAADGQPPRIGEGRGDNKPAPTARTEGGGDFLADVAAQGRVDRLEHNGAVGVRGDSRRGRLFVSIETTVCCPRPSGPRAIQGA